MALNGGQTAVRGQALVSWLEQPLGANVRQMELALLADFVPNVFGYYAVQVGYWGRPGENFASTRIPNCFSVSPPALDAPRADIVAELDMLPLASESVDAVLLPHSLEFSGHPHRLLREIDRILVPEGHMLILGFNPYGLWGWPRVSLRQSGYGPWCGRFIGEGRVRDWLTLLGYDIVGGRRYLYRPPVTHVPTLFRLSFMERMGRRLWPALSGAYLLLARKKVICMTPIKPRWRPRRALIPRGLSGAPAPTPSRRGPLEAPQR